MTEFVISNLLIISKLLANYSNLFFPLQQLDQLQADVDKLIEEINPDDLIIDIPFTDFIDDLNQLVAMTELAELNYTAYEEVVRI